MKEMQFTVERGGPLLPFLLEHVKLILAPISNQSVTLPLIFTLERKDL